MRPAGLDLERAGALQLQRRIRGHDRDPFAAILRLTVAIGEAGPAGLDDAAPVFAANLLDVRKRRAVLVAGATVRHVRAHVDLAAIAGHKIAIRPPRRANELARPLDAAAQFRHALAAAANAAATAVFLVAVHPGLTAVFQLAITVRIAGATLQAAESLETQAAGSVGLVPAALSAAATVVRVGGDVDAKGTAALAPGVANAFSFPTELSLSARVAAFATMMRIAVQIETAVPAVGGRFRARAAPLHAAGARSTAIAAGAAMVGVRIQVHTLPGTSGQPIVARKLTGARGADGSGRAGVPACAAVIYVLPEVDAATRTRSPTLSTAGHTGAFRARFTRSTGVSTAATVAAVFTQIDTDAFAPLRSRGARRARIRTCDDEKRGERKGATQSDHSQTTSAGAWAS